MNVAAELCSEIATVLFTLPIVLEHVRFNVSCIENRGGFKYAIVMVMASISHTFIDNRL